jgi:hypothetical protein
VVGAVALDLVAPVAGEHVTVVTLVGAALTLLAIVVGTGLLHRRRPAG